MVGLALPVGGRRFFVVLRPPPHDAPDPVLFSSLCIADSQHKGNRGVASMQHSEGRKVLVDGGFSINNVDSGRSGVDGIRFEASICPIGLLSWIYVRARRLAAASVQFGRGF